jgi:hypothetical protein
VVIGGVLGGLWMQGAQYLPAPVVVAVAPAPAPTHVDGVSLLPLLLLLLLLWSTFAGGSFM